MVERKVISRTTTNLESDYKYGFYTDIDADMAPRGLNEDIVKFISKKKNEPDWMLEWRLKAYRHWLTMREPKWAKVHHDRIDYQQISYYSAPKQNKDGPKSLEHWKSVVLELSRPTHKKP